MTKKSNHEETFYLDEANVDNLKKALIGHSITSVYYDKLTLDNDCILTIEDSCECCAHYSGEFNWDKQPPENVITNVVLDDHIQVGDDEAFRIVVMAQDKKIADLSVIGNEGTGCYMRSVYFTVSGPFEKNYIPGNDLDSVARNAWRFVGYLRKFTAKDSGDNEEIPF